MAVTVEALVNQALVSIGYPGRVNDMFEDGPAAKAALEVYGQTRDELLDAGDWPLARRANIPLTLLKGPPPAGGYNPGEPWSGQYPPSGWLYEYAYPDDMLDLRAVLPRPGAMFDLLPQPAVWRVDNDNSGVNSTGAAMVETKVILTNVKDALAVYIAQIIDPNLWEPGFTKIVVLKLGEKLARVLQAGDTIARVEMAEGKAELPEAEQARG